MKTVLGERQLERKIKSKLITKGRMAKQSYEDIKCQKKYSKTLKAIY